MQPLTRIDVKRKMYINNGGGGGRTGLGNKDKDRACR